MTLFDGAVISAADLPRSSRGQGPPLAQMHARFGHGADAVTCGTCQHLVKVTHGSRAYWKCRRYGVTRSEHSDWRKKWAACGAWTARA